MCTWKSIVYHASCAVGSFNKNTLFIYCDGIYIRFCRAPFEMVEEVSLCGSA